MRARTGDATDQKEHKVDRTHWPPGPWMSEPDKLNWRTEAGLPGMIVRNQSGGLCGYVAVTKEHPAYAKDWDSLDDIRVHGGLTYANKCGGAICHVPEPGEPDDVWWLGFDCVHYRDWSPADYAPYLRDLRRMPDHFNQYRDVDYVRREVESLARQLAEMSNAQG